jgi:hypothetical protein
MTMKVPKKQASRPARIYFSDFFGVSPQQLADYGAFNVSPVVDLPLFIDPFLLFTSDKPEYRLFYDNAGTPIKREKDLQIAFKLVWHGSPSSVDAEVNNGRGPVDFKISRGASDSTLVEFKLASNSKLESNLAKQVEIYKAANNTKQSYKVVLFFDAAEEKKIKDVLKTLKATEDTGIILVDGRRDNKPSASKA